MKPTIPNHLLVELSRQLAAKQREEQSTACAEREFNDDVRERLYRQRPYTEPQDLHQWETRDPRDLTRRETMLVVAGLVLGALLVVGSIAAVIFFL